MLRQGTLCGRRRAKRWAEDVNPMESVANLADIMLVFACGLMIAIILNWNVDLSRVVDVLQKDELVEVENPEEIVQDAKQNQKYNEKGVVYEDPETGKMYVLVP